MRVSKRFLTIAEALAFLAGALVFWQLLRLAGFDALRQAWDAAGPRLAAVFALYPLMTCWDVASWRMLFAPAERPGFASLFWIRLAGESVNNITPGVDIGGEPLKVKWVCERAGVPAAQATSATILAKTALLVGEGVFVWLGLAAAWTFLPWPPGVRVGFLLAAVIVGAVIASIFLFQRTAIFGGWSPQTREFYRRAMPRFLGASALNLVGWLSGAVELWAFAWILGVSLDWRQALALEALVQLVRTASFFIPGNVGTQEAGYVFLTRLMGFDPSLGMALSLLKRARQIAWTATGFGVWAVFRMSAQLPSPSQPQPSLDTALDRWIHRPPGRLLARVLAPTSVTPNAVTLLSIAPAALAATFFAHADAWFQAAGILCFYAWAVLDHVDGELARLQNAQSHLGRILDDACDIVSSTLMLVGVWLGLAVYWNAHDRAVLDRLFYSALVLNTSASLLALAVRRDRQAPVGGRRALEWLAGREPFYLVLVLSGAAHVTGHPALYAFLGAFLIAGQGVLFAVALWAFLARRA